MVGSLLGTFSMRSTTSYESSSTHRADEKSRRKPSRNAYPSAYGAKPLAAGGPRSTFRAFIRKDPTRYPNKENPANYGEDSLAGRFVRFPEAHTPWAGTED